MSQGSQGIIIAAIGFGAGAFVVMMICISIVVYRIIDAPSHIIESHRKDPKDVVLYSQRDDDLWHEPGRKRR